MTKMSSISCLLLLLSLGSYAAGYCQIGTVVSAFCQVGSNCQWVKPVTFDNAFPRKPKVVTAIFGLQSGNWNGGNINIRVHPVLTTITTAGFDIDFGVVPITRGHIYRVRATWTACL
ncbi:uncharacterized protein LOC106167003 [Lingula anatina]|uniref:Uncharacterized protein LOC106167003 n=1 Tax=Lingula anatina TaxID=7574 RepID=A0A1S3ISR9_LINAN|nr:uncharacterized protein LOC106167003 [Lingula anatina]|eukprot:XP_013401118.1 uncharacterized protein LOC106167003 [Lingula anatina]